MVFCDPIFAFSAGKLISCVMAYSWRYLRELYPKMLWVKRTRNRLTWANQGARKTYDMLSTLKNIGA